MSRLIQFYETGGPEVQRIEEVVVPAPGPGEVRIRVAAIGLNRSDLIFVAIGQRRRSCRRGGKRRRGCQRFCGR